MKNKFYIALLLFIGIACKKELRPTQEAITTVQGTLLDTFTLEPIPNCRAFLLDYTKGREQIIGEQMTDDLGVFSFSEASFQNQIQFAHNDYAWHSPQSSKQDHYYVSPYVQVYVKLDPSPGILIKELRGSFNDSPINLPITTDSFMIQAEVYDSLHLGLVKQMKSGTEQFDTSYFTFFINKKVSHFTLKP